MVLCFRYWQVQHICCLNIRNLFEHCHKFRQVIEFCEPCLCSVSSSFRCKFHCRNGFSESGSPSVEVLQPVFHKRVVLQISLYRVEFHHTVRDRCTRCKYCSSPSGNLVKVTTLHKEVGRFLCFGLCDTTHITHFCIEIKVLVIVALVNKKPVYTKFLKGYNIIFLRLVIEFIQFLTNGFL